MYVGDGIFFSKYSGIGFDSVFVFGILFNSYLPFFYKVLKRGVLLLAAPLRDSFSLLPYKSLNKQETITYFQHKRWSKPYHPHAAHPSSQT
nr:MAG TPA: hypothetical protein [Caudoviricetes sp.]